MTTAQTIQKYNEAQTEVKRLWVLMCHADGVHTASKFVVFAGSNPYAVAYNEAVAAFQQIRKQIKRNEVRRERHAAIRFAAKHPGVRVTL